MANETKINYFTAKFNAMPAYRKVSLLSLSLAAAAFSFGQTEAVQKAQVDVSIVNAKNLPREGQVVVFTGAKNTDAITAQTNKLGRVSLQLPTGDDYGIGIKDMAETSQQTTLSIPSLKPGETLTGAYRVNIVYEPARTITLSNVQFDVSKATLRPSSFKDLQELIEYMRTKKTEKIEIGGHTDSSGIEEKNVLLSQERADAIKAYLVKAGIAADNIIAKGYGSSQPISDNQTPEGKAKNRRTEVRRIVE